MCVIACKVYVSDFASSVLSARPAIPRFGTQQVGDMKDSLCLFFFKESIPDDPSISLRAVQKKLMGQKMINTLTTTDKLSLPLVHEDVGVVRYTTAEPGYSPSTDGSPAIRVVVLDEASLALLCNPAISRFRFRTRHVLPITHPYHCGITERRPERQDIHSPNNNLSARPGYNLASTWVWSGTRQLSPSTVLPPSGVHRSNTTFRLLDRAVRLQVYGLYMASLTLYNKRDSLIIVHFIE
jgi:hypothetical protein